MNNKKIKYAIIGCGNIAPAHAEGVLACRDAELYAFCDIDEEKARRIAESYGVKRYFKNYRDMLKLKEIDIVSICTPSGMHSEMVVDCAKAGKHVLCEKPLDVTKEKLDIMINVCKQERVKMGAIFQNRTYSGTRAAKKMIEQGILGKVLIADGYCKEYRSPEYYRSADWRGTKLYDGGGCLMNQGIHCIDLLCWFAGKVDSIIANVFTMARDIEVEDSAFALVRFSNGAYGVIEGSTVSIPGRDDHVEIQCENGRIVYDAGTTTLQELGPDGTMVIKPLDSEPVYEQNAANDPLNFENAPHIFLVGDMVRAVIEDRDPYITGEMARYAVDVILGIYQSSAVGMEVKIV
jgi:UDP-N-acetyl-2-amino-2-deoxyglucuronate dehydrogenase